MKWPEYMGHFDHPEPSRNHTGCPSNHIATPSRQPPERARRWWLWLSCTFYINALLSCNISIKHLAYAFIRSAFRLYIFSVLASHDNQTLDLYIKVLPVEQYMFKPTTKLFYIRNFWIDERETQWHRCHYCLSQTSLSRATYSTLSAFFCISILSFLWPAVLSSLQLSHSLSKHRQVILHTHTHTGLETHWLTNCETQ